MDGRHSCDHSADADVLHLHPKLGVVPVRPQPSVLYFLSGFGTVGSRRASSRGLFGWEFLCALTVCAKKGMEMFGSGSGLSINDGISISVVTNLFPIRGSKWWDPYQ